MEFTENKNSISVMMLITSFRPFAMGGSELQAFRLAKELKKKGLNIYIVSLGLKDTPKEECIEGIMVYRMYSFLNKRLLLGNKKNKKEEVVKIEYEPQNPSNFKITDKKTLLSFIPYFFFFLKVWLFAKKRKEPIDYIYIPVMEWTSFIGALLGKVLNKKVVIKDSTVNGITNILRYPLGQKMQKTIITYSYFIAMTQAIKKNYLQAGIAEKKTTVIPNGVNVPVFQYSKETNGRFIFVGNLHQQPAKGVDILLKAWKVVVAEIPAAQLSIIGDGNIQAYTNYVSKLGIQNNVCFWGKQTQVRNYLQESFAFVLPSRREGMSNALLEAMALGLPCIATDISGSQDLIQNNVNGILVPVEDVTALANAIIYVYKNPGKSELMGIEARKTIEHGYTIDLIAQKYFDLFV